MSDQLLTRLAAVTVSSLCDADKTLRVLDPALRPLRDNLRLLGRAVPVACADDFLTVLDALSRTEPGDVLVVDARGTRRAVAGGLFATEAARRGLGGMIVDGAVRDVTTIRSLSVPVYARSVNPMAGTAERLFASADAVTCGGVDVRRGDIVVGDPDGVVVGTASEFSAVIERAEEIEVTEARVLASMAEGRSLTTMLNLADHVRAVREGRESGLRFLE